MAADVTQLVGRRSPDQLPENKLKEAIIRSTPEDTAHGVMVSVPSFHPHRLWGPCPWQPLTVDEDTYATPSAGDRALIAVSDDDQPWVVMWWPKEYENLD